MSLVLKNLTSLSLSRLVSLVSAFFLSVVMARKLGPDVYGVYALVFVMIAYFASFVDFGVSEIVVREIASLRWKPQALYRPVVIMRWGLYSIAFLVFAAYEIAVQDPKSISLLFGMLILLGEVMYGGFEAIFRGTQKMFWLSVSEMVFAVTRMALGIGALFLGYGLNHLLLAIAIATWIKLILIYWQYTKNFEKAKNDGNVFNVIRFLFHDSKMIALWRLASAIYLQMNIPLIIFYLGQAAGGHFKVAMNLIEIPAGFLSVASSVLFPYLAELKVKDLHTYFRTTEKILSMGGVFFFIMFFVVQAVGKGILILIFSEKYHVAADLLPVLFFLVYTNFILVLLSIYLLIEKMQKTAFTLTIINIVMKSIVFWTVFNYGPNTALIDCCWLIVILEWFSILWIVLSLFQKKVLAWRLIQNPVLVTTLGIIPLLLQNAYPLILNPVWSCFVNIVIFISTLLFFKVISWSEMRLYLFRRSDSIE
jgi:O-antigen/teichoic acid export membrane protein